MESTKCSSYDDVDDEDCEKMENTMCSSSDDVDDEDLQFVLTIKHEVDKA